MKVPDLSEQEKAFVEMDVFRSYIKWRNRFALKIAAFHLCLVFIFDLISYSYPELMLVPVWPESAITFSLACVIYVTFSVIFSAFYYGHKVNKESSKIENIPRESHNNV